MNTATESTVYDVIIIGGGVAALSAGIYTSRDNFSTLILEGTILSSTDSPGGALLLTESIENFPGYTEGSGYGLIEKIREQAESFGARITEERAVSLDVKLIKGQLHEVITNEGNAYQARAIIIATGAVARRLGVNGEDAFFGMGVSTCATCDGWAFKEKTVIVVGGGDTAVEDALLLSKGSAKVYMAVRGKEFRTQSPEARKLMEQDNVEILWETVVEEVFSDETKTKVGAIAVRSSNDQNPSSRIIPVDGVFVAIGSDPATGFLGASAIMLDLDGYVRTVDGSTRVQGAVPGVFAAGDVNESQKVFRQAITSAGNAVQAALEARAYLIE